MWSAFHFVILKYIMGGPLEALEADIHLYSKQIKDLKRGKCFEMSRRIQQAFLNLLGRDNKDDPTRMTGKAYPPIIFENNMKNDFFATGIRIFQGMLLTFFSKHVEKADKVLEVGHDFLQKANVANPNNMWDTFLTAVSSFAAARETKKKKYAKLGQICRKKIKKWLEMGNPTVMHYESLIDAERMAYQGNKYAALKHYEAAILLSAHGGYQQDAALASERLGEFHLTVMNDKDQAAYYFGQSLKYWKDWGAMAKVYVLQDAYADILPETSSIPTVISSSCS